MSEIERKGRRTVAGTVVAVMPLLLWTGGCGDLTSGGFGELEVEIAADSLGSGASFLGPAGSIASSVENRGAGSPSYLDHSFASAIIEATLTTQVRVFVRRGLRDWEEVTDGPQTIVLSLREGGTGLVAREEFPAGTYDRVAIVFRRVEVDVTRGLVVDGDTITGRVRVELEADRQILVVRPVDLVVREGDTTVLLMEMRTSLWLLLLDRLRRVVDADDFRALFRLRVRDGA